MTINTSIYKSKKVHEFIATCFTYYNSEVWQVEFTLNIYTLSWLAPITGGKEFQYIGKLCSCYINE